MAIGPRHVYTGPNMGVLIEAVYRAGGRWLYDAMYRVGAPWDVGPGRYLVDAVTRGDLAPGRTIDLGCGSGSNAIFLADHGFDVVGVDFSSVALARARQRAAKGTGAGRVRFVLGDVRSFPISGAEGPFDLVLDYGVLHDQSPLGRRAVSRCIAQLLRPGGELFIFCFYGAWQELPWFAKQGATRLFPMTLKPGEETELFGD